MPRRRREQDEEASTVAPSQSQASQGVSCTQAEKAMASMENDERRKRLTDLVQFILTMDQKKQPIKKQDINKHVLKENSKAFPIMIKKAEEQLLEVFGFKLIELEDKLKGTYILVNEVDFDVEENENSDFVPITWSEEDHAKTGLLMVVLSMIYMNQHVITEDQLWHTLRRLGIEQDSTHAVFGDVKKLITQEFVKQGYLDHIRLQMSDPPSFEFRWGQRAKHEVPKTGCLDFVSQVYNMQPQQWVSQFNDLQSEETSNDEG